MYYKMSSILFWKYYRSLPIITTFILMPLHSFSGSALAANVCKKITGRLTSAIAKQEDVSVQLEALDIMADMLSR